MAENLRGLRRDVTVRRLKSLLDSSPDLLHEAGIHLIQRMSPTKRGEFLQQAAALSESGAMAETGVTSSISGGNKEEETDVDVGSKQKESGDDSSESGDSTTMSN